MIWGLVIIYILIFIELLYTSYHHGKPRENWNLWIKFGDMAIVLFLIWWALGWVFW